MNHIFASPFPEDPETLALAEAIRLRLTWLPYDAFTVCMGRLLKRMGFVSVERSSRRSLKGPNDTAGIDARAFVDTGVGLTPVAIQFKRYKGPAHVPKQFVIQLRGAMLERSIPSGIVFSTYSFSKEAHEAATIFSGRPIRLVEGLELGRLLVRYRIGVAEHTDIATGRTLLSFDEDVFTQLEDECRARRQRRVR